jgi:hypothetical protein
MSFGTLMTYGGLYMATQWWANRKQDELLMKDDAEARRNAVLLSTPNTAPEGYIRDDYEDDVMQIQALPFTGNPQTTEIWAIEQFGVIPGDDEWVLGPDINTLGGYASGMGGGASGGTGRAGAGAGGAYSLLSPWSHTATRPLQELGWANAYDGRILGLDRDGMALARPVY